MSAPPPVAEYTAPVPPYKEVIVEQQWARQVPDPLQIIENIRRWVDSAMGVPDVFGNPLVADIMEGILSLSDMDVIYLHMRFCVFNDILLNFWFYYAYKTYEWMIEWMMKTWMNGNEN